VKGLAHAARADILRAARDAIGEMDATAVKGDPARCADAHEAAPELELFLRHIASDFAAIDDLPTRKRRYSSTATTATSLATFGSSRHPPTRCFRRYHTYDLLLSDSGFTEDTFKRVWRDVLTFCSASGGTATAEKVA
jgi:hypothetical protein